MAESSERSPPEDMQKTIRTLKRKLEETEDEARKAKKARVEAEEREKKAKQERDEAQEREKKAKKERDEAKKEAGVMRGVCNWHRATLGKSISRRFAFWWLIPIPRLSFEC